MPTSLRASLPGRVFAVAGGLLFVASLLYFLVQFRLFGYYDGPWTGEGWSAIIFDVALFSLFALHHSICARTGVKSAIQARTSPQLERSIYVWIASVLFIVTLASWKLVPGMLWHVEGAAAWILHTGKVAGLVLTIVAALAIDPLELAGIRQAFGSPAGNRNELTSRGAYGLVRHPIYLGWLLIVWSVASMTATRFVFAAISTLYLVVAIPLEEREMRRTLGEPYAEYARAVRWRMVPWIY